MRRVFLLNNLLGTPEFARLRGELEKRMRELRKEAGNPGDASKIIAHREPRRPENLRHDTLEGAGKRSDNKDEKRDLRGGKGTGSTIQRSAS